MTYSDSRQGMVTIELENGYFYLAVGVLDDNEGRDGLGRFARGDREKNAVGDTAERSKAHGQPERIVEFVSVPVVDERRGIERDDDGRC